MCITFGPLTKSGFDVIRFLMCQLAVRDLPSCPQSSLFKSEWPLGTYQEFIRKDRRKELLYYVNLIRAC